jgi:predicted ABC-type ATPase
VTRDAIARHTDLVRELSKPGRVLAPDSPTSTTNNPQWWINGDRTPVRRQLHRRLLAEARDTAPHVEQDRRAIILAGPPGAGKSTVLGEILGSDRDKFLVVDADEFKRSLLLQAQADGSYDTWIMPDAIRELEASGEKFFPLELASLVHEESSFLAKALRATAIEAGDNIVIDTVLSSESSATKIGSTLQAAGYNIQVIDVEVPYELSQARISKRWKHSYAAALEGRETLGGRWVPSEYAHDVFDTSHGRSKPEIAAQMLAQTCPAVTRYRRFRTEFEGAEKVTEVDQIRASNGGPLVNALPDVDAMIAVRAAFPGSTLSTSTMTDPRAARRARPHTVEADFNRD